MPPTTPSRSPSTQSSPWIASFFRQEDLTPQKSPSPSLEDTKTPFTNENGSVSSPKEVSTPSGNQEVASPATQDEVDIPALIAEPTSTHKRQHEPTTGPAGIGYAFPGYSTDSFNLLIIAEKIFHENLQHCDARTQTVKGKKYIDWVSEYERP